MTARTTQSVAPDERAPTAREVWSLMCDVVLANVRRREASEAVGLSFGRLRAIRRLARQPMSMSELAHSLTIDPPNATVVVDELEALGLVRRRAHSTDRRAKMVEATRKGKNVAQRADEILSIPPPELDQLGDEDLQTLWRILAGVAAS
jgi:DNA-binding MarR family transcriptional regulator